MATAFICAPATADTAQFQLLKYGRFAQYPDSFAIVPFQVDELDLDVPMPTVCFGLRFDDRVIGRDAGGNIVSDVEIAKTPAVFSTGIKAAEALVAKLQTPEYADIPGCLRIAPEMVDEPDWKTEANKRSGPYSAFWHHRL